MWQGGHSKGVVELAEIGRTLLRAASFDLRFSARCSSRRLRNRCMMSGVKMLNSHPEQNKLQRVERVYFVSLVRSGVGSKLKLRSGRCRRGRKDSCEPRGGGTRTRGRIVTARVMSTPRRAGLKLGETLWMSPNCETAFGAVCAVSRNEMLDARELR